MGLKGFAWRVRDVVTAAAILMLTALIVVRLGGEGGDVVTGVARAADGDTLTLGGVRIRLLGIDTPELAQPCRRDGADWQCGVAARARLAELLRRGAVSCSTRGTDRYGRVLARCHVEDEDIGERLVREGLAVAYGDYEAGEAAARAERRGLWAGEFERPQDWRRLAGRPLEDRHIEKTGLLGTVRGFFGLD